jgi:hypothetical protein
VKTSELFETPPFLEHRLGSNVFDEIPQKPGIYRFYNGDDKLLYVGKAKNLRRRLFTYKRAKPGKTSRKESALLSKISRFEFDVHESEQDAILQENRWIREHRPEFNHANKYTETYYFITVQQSESAIVFGLAMNPSGQLFPEKQKPLYEKLDSVFYTDFDSKTYGCYKGHRIVRASLGALLQLLWMAEFGSVSPHFLPIQLSRNLTPMRFQFPIQNRKSSNIEELKCMLDEWFLGNSPDLIHHLNENIDQTWNSTFATNFVEGNLEILESYFQRNLHRYRMMREIKQDQETHLIDQTELDDLISTFKNNQQQSKDN